ncbi:MAG: hypothetical protein O7J95_19550, partial [Planctomycetota bacterium]|nr:hypothetical protein [Planctomycetota bacterium]
ADEQARERLLREIPEIPMAPADFQARLGQVASMLGRLGSDRVPSLRRDWEDEVVDSLLPDFPALPVREPECLLWLRTALFELRRRLGVEFIAVFAPGPERLDEAAAFLPLAAENGLSGDAGTRDAGTDAPETGKPLLELHPRRLLKSLGESAPVALGLHAVSRLIGALRASDASPPGWKDRLTKAIFVAPVTPLRGLEMVFVYGAPTGDVRPEDDDLDVLWRAAGRIANQYLIVLSENGRQVAAEQVRKLAKVDEPKRKPSPIRPQRFDIVRLIGACVDKQRELASGRDVSFDVRGLPERLMVEADRNKLHSVVDVVLHYASRSARSEDASGGASILVGCRRDKRSRGRVNVTVDMLGDFLSGDEQRALLRSETPPEAAPAPPASEADEPTGGEPTGGNGSAEDADSQVRAASAETRGDGGKESGTERDGGKPDRGFISFKEAQRYLSWHGGRLALECVRTREVASRWLGRTVFTLSFREVRREQSEPARSERSEPARSEPARHEKSRPESRGG